LDYGSIKSEILITLLKKVFVVHRKTRISIVEFIKGLNDVLKSLSLCLSLDNKDKTCDLTIAIAPYHNKSYTESKNIDFKSSNEINDDMD